SSAVSEVWTGAGTRGRDGSIPEGVDLEHPAAVALLRSAAIPAVHAHRQTRGVCIDLRQSGEPAGKLGAGLRPSWGAQIWSGRQRMVYLHLADIHGGGAGNRHGLL